jgi:hypothetical protein
MILVEACDSTSLLFWGEEDRKGDDEIGKKFSLAPAFAYAGNKSFFTKPSLLGLSLLDGILIALRNKICNKQISLVSVSVPTEKQTKLSSVE